MRPAARLLRDLSVSPGRWIVSDGLWKRLPLLVMVTKAAIRCVLQIQKAPFESLCRQCAHENAMQALPYFPGAAASEPNNQTHKLDMHRQGILTQGKICKSHVNLYCSEIDFGLFAPWWSDFSILETFE
jgi:hypothetical protein